MGKFWHTYIVPYFRKMCSETLDAYMKGLGFCVDDVSDIGATTYARKNVFLSVTYWPEDAPNYFLMASVGLFEPCKKDRKRFRREMGIGYMYAPLQDPFPPAERLFRNEQELKEALEKVRDLIIDVYARPLFDNPDQLLERVKKTEEEHAAIQQEEIRQHQIQQARIAFDHGDFLRCISIYENIDPAYLEHTDRRRLYVAKKQARKK